MKHIPRLQRALVPLFCFLLAWGLTHWLRHADPPRLADKPVPAPGRRALPLHPARLAAPAGPSLSVPARELVASFHELSLPEWIDSWHTFADNADAAALLGVVLAPVETDDPQSEIRWMLQSLASEELAVRLPEDDPAFTSLLRTQPGPVLCALAEHDADRAWALAAGAENAEWPSGQLLATLAWRDAAHALELLHAREDLPNPLSSSSREPEARLFAGWAWREPAAAAAAAAREAGEVRRRVLQSVLPRWAAVDGRAALDFSLAIMGGDNRFEELGLKAVVSEALRQNPPAAAQWLADHRDFLTHSLVLSNADGQEFMRRWYAAAPGELLGFLQDRADPTEESNLVQWIDTVSRLDCGRAAELLLWAAPLLKSHPLPDGPSGQGRTLLLRIGKDDPQLGRALAEQFGTVREFEEAAMQWTIQAAPAAALEKWRNAAAQDHDSLTRLGWTSAHALQLAAFAAVEWPDQAAALAALVPAEEILNVDLRLALRGRPRVEKAAVMRLWASEPESAQASPVAPSSMDARFFASLCLDPARTAARMAPESCTPAEAWNTVALWAPHDAAAARAWAESLPPGPARALAEMAMAPQLSAADPAAALELLSAQEHADLAFAREEAGAAWVESLRRLVRTGGAWEDWLASTPPALSGSSGYDGRPLRESLLADAAMLAALRKGVKPAK